MVRGMKSMGVLGAVIGIGLLAGCSSAPPAEITYQSVNDLAKVYEKAANVDCRKTDTDMSENQWDQTQCGDHAVVMVFASDAKRQEILDKNPLETGEVYIQGGNWLISAYQFEAERANKKLGGKITSS